MTAYNLNSVLNALQTDEATKLAVWNKATKINSYDPSKYRQDLAGAWMQWDKFGNTQSELGLGWEIDHRKPKSKGGSSDINNLRSLQWSNNRSKGDDYPRWSSCVSSAGNKNVHKDQKWRID